MSSESSPVGSPGQDDSVQAWLQSIERTRRKSTVNDHFQRIHRYADFLSRLGKQPVEAEIEDVQAFFDGDLAPDRLTAGTIQGYKATVMQYHRFVELDDRFLSEDSVSYHIQHGISPEKYADPYPRPNQLAPLNAEECQELMVAADRRSPRHGLTVLLILATGIRRGEAAAFTPEWFDTEANLIRIPSSPNPSNTHFTPRMIPLPSKIAETLALYIELVDEDAFGIAPSTVYERVRSAGKEAIMDVSPRRLRRTYAKHLSKTGLTLPSRSELLGLTTPCGHSRYLHDDGNAADFNENLGLYEGLDLDFVGDD